MKKILVANSKGGSGKSTLAIALADVLNAQLVDFDNQGSLTFASKITARHIPIKPSKATKKYLVYDTPPYLSEELPALIKEADLILIPTKIGQYDLLALKGILDMVRKTNSEKKCFLILNEVKKPKPKTYLRTRDFFFTNFQDIKKAKTELSYLMA
jgi:chromosome partitioning protein